MTDNPWENAPSDWRYLSMRDNYDWSKTMPAHYITEHPELEAQNKVYIAEDKAIAEIEKKKWSKYISKANESNIVKETVND